VHHRLIRNNSDLRTMVPYEKIDLGAFRWPSHKGTLELIRLSGAHRHKTRCRRIGSLGAKPQLHARRIKPSPRDILRERLGFLAPVAEEHSVLVCVIKPASGSTGFAVSDAVPCHFPKPRIASGNGPAPIRGTTLPGVPSHASLCGVDHRQDQQHCAMIKRRENSSGEFKDVRHVRVESFSKTFFRVSALGS
jgi:hypothetical protein